MILEQTYSQSLTAAQSFTDKSYSLVTKPNTVLGELVKLSSLVYFANFGIVDNTRDTLEGPSQHSLALNSYVEDIGKAVLGHIKVAKSTVAPLVGELADEIHKFYEKEHVQEPSAKFNIIVERLPDFLNEGMIKDAYEMYSSSGLLTPDRILDLSYKDKTEIIDLMSTGSKSIDISIAKWASNLPETYLESVWDMLFTMEDARHSVTIGFDLSAMQDSRQLYGAITLSTVVFLISRKILEVTQDSALDLQKYRKIVTQYLTYSGACICTLLNKAKLFDRSETLVTNLLENAYTAYVNGTVYDSWLAEGNQVETIFGLIVSGKRIYTKSMINAAKDELQRNWQSYYAFSKTSDNNKFYRRFLDYIVSIFKIMLNQITPTEEIYLEKMDRQLYFRKVYELLDQEIKMIRPDELEDVYGIAERLIGKCRFYYTSSYQILSDIRKVTKINPNLEVREAALVAMINYLTDYVSDQITINKEIYI